MSNSNNFTQVLINRFFFKLLIYQNFNRNIIIDVCNFKFCIRTVPMVLWICLYAPGFSCMVYVCDYIATFSECSSKFMIINKTLEEFTYPELSCTEIYLLRKRKVRPCRLLKTLSNDGQNMLDKVWINKNSRHFFTLCQKIFFQMKK